MSDRKAIILGTLVILCSTILTIVFWNANFLWLLLILLFILWFIWKLV